MPPLLAASSRWTGARPAIFSISHGVRITATKKEKIIAAEALAGIGLI